MSERDPLAELLRRHDRPVTPSADFAGRLEARLLAELGQAAAVESVRQAEPIPVRLRPRGGAGPTVSRRPRWLDVAAAAVLLIGVMGGMLSQLAVRDSGGDLIDPPGTIAAPDFLSTAAGEEAPVMEGGSPARDNRFGGPAPTQGELVERWVAPNPSPSDASFQLQVIPFGDTVYRVTGIEEWNAAEDRFRWYGYTLSAYRLDTGAPIWSRPTADAVEVAVAEAGVVAILPVEPGAATAGAARSRLALLDHATGEEIWSYPLPAVAGDNRRSPLVDGETVYYADIEAKVYALDLETGRERWVSARAAAPAVGAEEGCLDSPVSCGFGAFVLGDGALYVSNSVGMLTAVETADGTSRWQVDLTKRYGIPARSIALPVAVAGGVILNLIQDASDPVTGAVPGRFVRLDAADGASVWEHRIAGQTGFEPVADEARLYIGQINAFETCCAILALDLFTGETRWQSVSNRISPLGMVAGGDLYAVGAPAIGTNQLLYALDPETGAERWHQLVPAGRASLPLAHDGTMLVDDEGRNGTPGGMVAYLPANATATPAEEPAA